MSAPDVEPALLLAPSIPDLAALGARGFEDFLDGGAGLETADRARAVAEWRGETVTRVPLPGTSDHAGRRREPPRGAGTGWMLVHGFSGGAAELARARFTRPRSSSLAARRWNLLCHLRAHGIGAPEPLAMGERPGPLAAVQSFLVVRELTGWEPLPRFLREARDRQRRLGLTALGLTIAALFRCGAWLPETTADDVLVRRGEAGGADAGEESCAALEIERLRGERDAMRALRLERVRLPGVALTALRRARLLERVSPRRRIAWLRAVDSGVAELVTDRERLRVASLALDRAALRRCARG